MTSCPSSTGYVCLVHGPGGFQTFTDGFLFGRLNRKFEMDFYAWLWYGLKLIVNFRLSKSILGFWWSTVTPHVIAHSTDPGEVRSRSRFTPTVFNRLWHIYWCLISRRYQMVILTQTIKGPCGQYYRMNLHFIFSNPGHHNHLAFRVWTFSNLSSVCGE